MARMVVGTPIGLWIVEWSEQGIRRAFWWTETAFTGLPWTIEDVDTPDRRDPIARWLIDWLKMYRIGRWDLAIVQSVWQYRAPHTIRSTFHRRVYDALLRVPPGRTITYRELATIVSVPRAARAVGRAMATNPFPVLIPCHRVIRSDGTIGAYAAGTPIKRWLLNWEQSVTETTCRSTP